MQGPSYGHPFVGVAGETVHRSQGFSMDRLREKGLHGVLHSLDGYATSGNDTFHTMRHLHPREVGLLNGMNPKHVSNCPEFHLRLELAAVGQMASPIQSNWVISQVLFQMSQQKLIQNANTRELSWLNFASPS